MDILEPTVDESTTGFSTIRDCDGLSIKGPIHEYYIFIE